MTYVNLSLFRDTHQSYYILFIFQQAKSRTHYYALAATGFRIRKSNTKMYAVLYHACSNRQDKYLVIMHGKKKQYF